MIHKSSKEEIASFTCNFCGSKWSISEFKGIICKCPHCGISAEHVKTTKELTHINCCVCSDWMSFEEKIDGDVFCTHCGVNGKLELKDD